MISSKFVVSGAILLTNLALVPAAFAAGDMLKPDEVQTTGVSSNPNNDSGVYLGAGLTFGQGRTTDSGATPGLATLIHIEPGYQVNRGSWNRVEFGADVFFGTLSYRLSDADEKIKGGPKMTLQVPFGLMARGGYGYSLGGGMLGIFRLGVGPALAKLKADGVENIGSAESDTTTGIAYQLGWQLVAPVGSSIDLTGGISWTQFQFDIGKLSYSGGSGDYNRSVLASVPAIDIGLRMRL